VIDRLSNLHLDLEYKTQNQEERCINVDLAATSQEISAAPAAYVVAIISFIIIIIFSK